MQAEHDPRFEGSEFSCAVCGNERVLVESDGTVTCPDCRESYSLVVREEFTLLETDGWAARVSTAISEDLSDAVN